MGELRNGLEDHGEKAAPGKLDGLRNGLGGDEPKVKTEKEIAREEKQRRLEEARKAKERDARLRELHEKDQQSKGKTGFFGKVFKWF